MANEFLIWCPSCGAGYRWRAEVSDREYPCSCGVVFRIPTTAIGQAYIVTKKGETRPVKPAPADGELELVDEPPLLPSDLDLVKRPDDDDDDQAAVNYSLDGVEAAAQDATAAAVEPGYKPAHGQLIRCQRCNAMTRADGMSCSSCGFNHSETPDAAPNALSLGDALEPAPPEAEGDEQPDRDFGVSSVDSMVKRARRRQAEDDAEQKAFQAEARLLDATLPWGMLGVGIVLMALTSALLSAGIADTFRRFCLTFAINLVVFPTYLIGIFVAASIIKQSYGEIRVVSLKLIALAFLPDAAGAFAGTMVAFSLGAQSQPWMFVNAARVLVGGYLFWYFIRTLFRLNAVEAIGVAVLMIVTSFGVRILLTAAALALGFKV